MLRMMCCTTTTLHTRASERSDIIGLCAWGGVNSPHAYLLTEGVFPAGRSKALTIIGLSIGVYM